MWPDKRETQPGYDLTGQVVAVPVGAIHELPLQRAFACLRVAPPCGAEAGAFLISLRTFGFFNRLFNLEFSELQTVREGKEQPTFH